MPTRPHYEAWTLPTDATFQKIIDVPAMAGSSGSRELSNYSDNTAMVRANWPGRDQVSKALLRRFVGTKVTDEWTVKRIDKSVQRPGSYELSGPQINGITEGLVIYPRTEHANVQDWIWDGDNILPSLNLVDLNHINEVWEVYLAGERYELDTSLVNTGTFTLTVESQTTAAIDFDATASEVQSALDALSSVNNVAVIQPDEDTREYFVVFEDPKDLSSDMTADWTGADTPGVLTKLNDGFDTSLNPTFTITVDGQTTNALPWDADARTVEGTAVGTPTGLQGLSTVGDVTVQGSGTTADPWIIIFYDPPVISSFSVSFAAGSAVVTRSEEGVLDPSPITKSQEADQRFDEIVHGTYSDPPIQVITDPAHQDGDSEWVLRINALSQFAGSQLLVNVEPNQTYQVKIRVKPTVDSSIRIVIRDITGNELGRSPVVPPYAANIYHELVIENLRIPGGVEQVIFRVALTSEDPAENEPFYVNWQHAEFIEGLPASTFTEIVRTLVEDGQSRGSFGFLDLDFTDALDSAGNTLDDESFTAFAFSNLDNVLADGDAMGYKWRVVAKDTPSGELTHDLQIYYEGEAEDLTASSGGPTVQAGAVRDASVVSRTPEFTVAVGWGSEGLYVEVEDAALVAEYGRIERVFDAEHLTSEESLTRLLEEKFREQVTNADALTAEVDDDAQQVPLVDYAEGSKIWWAFPDQDVPKVAKVVERVSWVEGLASSTYTLNGSEELSEYGAMARAVDHLLRQFKVRRRNRQRVTPTVQGGGGIPDVVIAANNTKFKEDADLTCDSLGTDEVTLLQAVDRLPSGGGWIHLLEGTYTFSSQFSLPGGSTSVKLTGAGQESTTIRLGSSAAVSSVLNIVGSGGADEYWFSFEDFTIDGNQAGGATSTSLVVCGGGPKTPIGFIKNVTLMNSSGIGLHASRPFGTWFLTDVTAIDNVGDGFRMRETSVQAKGIRSIGNGGAGYRAGYGGYHMIGASRFESNGDGGINHLGLLGGAAALILTGSVVTGNTGDGVLHSHDSGARTSVVVGNRVTNNSGRSIQVRAGSVVHSNLISGNGTDTPIPDQGNMVDGVWTGGSDDFATEAPQAVTFASQPSTELTVGSGSFRFVAPRAGTIVACRASLGDPATGADVIVDVNLNGSTIFSTQSNRPTVAASANVGTEATPDITAVAGGDWFTVDVDQIGSTYGGADLTVTVEIVWETT